MFNAIIGALVTAVLVVGGIAYFEEPSFGAQSGPEHHEPQVFLQPVTLGGNVFATSSVGAATYTAASLQNITLIQHTAASALTVTLPASTTMGAFLPKAGDTRTIYITPITTGITLAGGVGTELQTASSTATKFVNAGNLGRLDFVRKSDTDIEVLLTPGI